MITVENLSLQYGSQVLFSGADLQFTAGNSTQLTPFIIIRKHAE